MCVGGVVCVGGSSSVCVSGMCVCEWCVCVGVVCGGE